MERFDIKTPGGRNVKREADAAEKSLARRLGGIRQARSGADPAHPGDVKVGDFLLDLKMTKKASMSVTVGMLRKIRDEANGQGKHPSLVLRFDDVSGLEKEYVVMPMSVFRSKWEQ